MDTDFYKVLQEKVRNRSYVKIQYFTDIHEFMTSMSVLKSITMQEGMDHLLLASGECIPLDKIVRLDGMVAPDYEGMMDFTCDC